MMMMMMILYTNHFCFKIQVKNLLADISFKIYVKTPINNNHRHNGEILMMMMMVMIMMILFTSHFYFKIQVKNLLADISFKISKNSYQ